MNRRMLMSALLVALAVVAVVLAADVRSSRRALETGDVVFASSPAEASWTPRTRLGSLAADLLGVDHDLQQRLALQRYDAAVRKRLNLNNGVGVQTARASAQDALSLVAAGSGARASQAQTLLGILAFGGNATGAAQDQVDAAAADFLNAIRTDPSNTGAKFDLELLIRLSDAHGTRIGEGAGGGFGHGGRRGGGGGTPGSGY